MEMVVYLLSIFGRSCCLVIKGEKGKAAANGHLLVVSHNLETHIIAAQ